eukprot:m.260809 g.260809  ORF g.260809 m.260809 type:complete len:2240 (-) comp11043_c0_seq3:122-6841(-)
MGPRSPSPLVAAGLLVLLLVFAAPRGARCVSVLERTDSSLTIEWTAASGASGYNVSFVPLPAGYTGVPRERPAFTSACLAEPGAGLSFRFGRTTASACAEAATYGFCDAQTLSAGPGHVCLGWPMTAWPQLHTSFSQLFFDNSRAIFRIDYHFSSGAKTFQDRLVTAEAEGEPVQWRVFDEQRVHDLAGEWWFTAANSVPTSTPTSASQCCLSSDGGLWGAAPNATIEGKTGNLNVPGSWGHGNAGGEDALQCPTYYMEGQATTSSSVRSVLFMDSSCDSVDCAASECHPPSAVCCNGQCVGSVYEDLTPCSAVYAGSCVQGECSFAGTTLDAGNSTRLTIGGLATETKYRLFVQSYDNNGQLSPVSDGQGETIEGTPTAPPSDITATGTVPASISLQWSPPPFDNRRGVITGYKVLFRRSPSTDAQFNGVSDTNTTIDVGSTLSAAVKVPIGSLAYEVRMLAYTATGDGVASEAQTVTSGEGPPVGAPTVDLVQIEDTFGDFKWSAIDAVLRGGTITGYDIRGVTLNGTNAGLTTTLSLGSVLDGRLTGLAGNRLYDVSVRGRTATGAGPWSLAVRAVTRFAPTDGKVANLQIDSASSSLNVSWDALVIPAEDGSTLGYKLTYVKRPFGFPNVTAPRTQQVSESVCLGPPVSGKSFVFGITTASQCAEDLQYRYCDSGLSHTTTQAQLCLNWASSVWPTSSSSFSQLYYDGATPKYRIDYAFTSSSRTLRSRMVRAGNSGEAVQWTVRDGTQAYRMSGQWWFSNAANIPASPTSPTLACCMSEDDGLWGAAPNGDVEGNDGNLDVAGSWGHGNSGGDDTGCNVYYTNGATTTSSALRTVLFMDSSCEGVTCEADECRPVAGDCCNGQCIGSVYEDGTPCTSQFGGRCMSGKCVAGTVVDVGNATSHTISGLESFRLYRISVAAYTTETGDVAHVTQRSGDSTPTAGPTIQSASALGPMQVALRWTPPPVEDQRGIIQGYKALFQVSNHMTSRFGNDTDELSNVRLVDLGNTTAANITLPFGDVEFNMTLLAYTSAGDGDESTFVLVTSGAAAPQSAPTGLHGTALNGTAVRITWDALPAYLVGSASAPVSYEVHYRQVFPVQGADTIIRNITGESLDIVTETGAAELAVFVRAATALGDGPLSSAVTVRSSESTPVAAPSNVTARALSPTAALVAWEPLLEVESGGQIQEYILRVSAIQDSNNRTLSDLRELRVNASSTSVEIATSPHFLYTISVAAATRVGAGPVSAGAILRAAQGRPSRPINVEVVSVSASTIEVLWDAPVPANGIVMLYTVEWMDVVTGMKQQVNISGFEEHLTIVEVAPFRNFSVQVAAWTTPQLAADNAGQGPFSALVIAQTSEASSSAVRNLTLSVVSASSLAASWVPPASPNGIVTSYVVEYRLDGTGSTYLQVTTTNTSVLLRELQPASLYEVRVAPVNSAGRGFETVERQQTTEAIPSGTVYALEAFALNSTVLEVQWDEIPVFVRGGLVLGYHVAVVAAEQAGVVRNLTTSSHSIVVAGLGVWSLYNISVRGFTSAGTGPAAVVAARTGEAAPSGPPLDVTASTINSTAIRCSWAPPEPAMRNGIVVQYAVSVRAATETTTDQRVTTDTTIDVSELIPFTVYEVMVAAQTTAGSGPASAAVMAKTAEAAPNGAPGSVRVQTISSEALRVTWDTIPEVGRNGVIVKYNVSWSPQPLAGFDGATGTRGMSGSKLVEPSSSSSAPPLSTLIEGLAPAVEYVVRVAGATQAGQGPWSAAASNQTLDDAPGAAPDSIQLVTSTADSMTVSWRAPPLEQRNGELVEYRITWEQICEPSSDCGDEAVDCQLLPAESKAVVAPQNDSAMAILSGLRAHALYRVSVSAATSAGSGPTSAAAELLSGPAAPAGPVRNLTTHGVSSTSLFVEWECVALLARRGVIDHYVVEFVPSGSIGATPQSQVVSGGARQVLLSGLKKYTPYDVSVKAAHASLGQGPAAMAAGRTLADAPEGAPRYLSAFATSYTSINVSWLPPAPETWNGEIVGYRLRSAAVSNPTPRWFTTTDVSFEVSGLARNGTYDFQVLAFTKAGSGPLSEVIRAWASGQPCSGEEVLNAAGICQAARGSSSGSFDVVPIAGAAAGVIIIFLLLCCWLRRRRRQRQTLERSPETPEEIQMTGHYDNVSFQRRQQLPLYDIAGSRADDYESPDQSLYDLILPPKEGPPPFAPDYLEPTPLALRSPQYEAPTSAPRGENYEEIDHSEVYESVT